MGYDVHVTRKVPSWSGSGREITESEWYELVELDPDLRLDGKAESPLENGEVLVAIDPTMTVWTAHSQHPERMAWIWHCDGNVMSKNPDQELMIKLYKIAQKLDARVQGDEDEYYDSEGQMIRGERHVRSGADTAAPWWRFW